MANSTPPAPPGDPPLPARHGLPAWAPEAGGLVALAGMLAYFLGVSWRRWPDPIVDSGPQWYAAWRVSQGAALFGDFQWNYGPLSAYWNGFLFRLFGANLTVLFAANLVVYGAILALAYGAFRRAWGWLGACAACALFVAVFSFSALNAIGNYNYGSPYSHESAHGMLLLFLTVFAAMRWLEKPGAESAFLLGTCGGLAAVLKPEFMLACGLLGAAALALRFLRRRALSWREWPMLVAGVAWPTLAFTIAFMGRESFAAAFAHAANAWWVIVVKPIGASGFGAGMQQLAGLDHPWRNAGLELKAGLFALAVMGCVAFGSFAAILGLGLAWWLGDVRLLGQCLPLVAGAALIWSAVKVWRAWKNGRPIETSTTLQLILSLAAVAMLARMPLLSRVDHFGFFQAALAGMVGVAWMMGEAARRPKHRVGVITGFLVVALCGGAVALRSHDILAEKTQPVGSNVDRFYAFNRKVDPIGALVDWSAQKMAATPPGSSVVVIPDGWLFQVSEGLSVNFLARRVSPIPDVLLGAPEDMLVRHLAAAAPDYIVEISHNLPDPTAKPFGSPGATGAQILAWVNENYVTTDLWGEPFSGGQLKGARILRRRTPRK